MLTWKMIPRSILATFFTSEEFPSEVDYVLLSNILYNWSDETNMDEQDREEERIDEYEKDAWL